MKLLCTARTTLRDFGRYRYRKIVEGFIEAGWDVTLLAYCHDFGEPIKGLKKEVVAKNVKLTSPKPSAGNVRKVVSKAKELVKKEKFDAVLILYPDPIPGFSGVEAGKRLNVPIFMDYGDFFSGLVTVQFKLSKKQKEYFRKKEEYVIKNSDYVIVMNDFLRDRCLSLGKKRTQLITITNGADIIRCNKKNMNGYVRRYGLSKARPTILFAGTLSYDKGLYIFLKTIPKIFEKEHEIEFVIAGKGDDKAVNEFIRKLPAKQRKYVHFIGPHNRQWIKRIFCEAEVLVVPFMPTKFSIASCPLKLFEAMASKTCIVASALPGILEIIKYNKNGLLFKPGDLDDFFKKLDKVLRNKKLREKLKNNGYEIFKKRYEWRLIQKKYVSFVKQKVLQK